MKRKVGSSQLQLTFDFMEMSLIRAAVSVGFKTDNDNNGACTRMLARESLRAVSAAIVRAERMPVPPFDVALLNPAQKVVCRGDNAITFKDSLRGLLVWSWPFGIGGTPSDGPRCACDACQRFRALLDELAKDSKDLERLAQILEWRAKQARERQKGMLWRKEARV